MKPTKPTIADDLATIRAVYDANRQMLELLPAALEAAERLGEADYAGTQDLEMLLEAEGALVQALLLADGPG